MQKRISNKTITKNIATSVMVQAISLCVSFILNFAVPKFISEYQYAYWQTFVLYLGYVGVLHFGLLDGIVLRYSQYNYEDLDRQTFRSMFLILLISTSGIALFCCTLAAIFTTGITRITVILVAFGIITKNIYTYNSFLFQITNRIIQYAKIVIVQRVANGLFVIAMLLMGVDDFKWYCLAELIGDVAGSAAASFYNKGMYFGKLLPCREAFIEWKTNVSAGIMLMLATWSSILLLSGAKMIVQWRWGELVFGKVAFSFSVCNLFLAFVTAVSVVLFPALKRMERDKLPTLYGQIRSILSPVLLLALVCYFPGCWLIRQLLPQYAESLRYLGAILPMIVYTSKVNLLTNNYLKAYRKEKEMLAINAFSILISFMLLVVCAYVLDNLTAVLICVVAATMLNSILSEITVVRIIRVKIIKELVAEILLTVVFITSILTLNLLAAFFCYVCALIIYMIAFCKNIRNILRITDK